MNRILILIGALGIFLGVSEGTQDLWKVGNLPDYGSLCPFSKLCTSPGKNITQTGKGSSCCQLCSCDPTCHETSTCCPDVSHNTTHGLPEPKYKCIEAARLVDQTRGYTRNDYFESSSYNVVDDCPGTNNSKLSELCDRPEKLADYVLVSDVNTGKAYKNKYCALCHGIEEIVEWKLTIDGCDIWNIPFNSFSERDEFIIRNCYIDVSPPSQRLGYMVLCNLNVVQSCNKIGRWDFYDKAIEEACQNNFTAMNAVFTGDITPVTGKNIMYANVYCYICNGKRSQYLKLPERTCSLSNVLGIQKSPALAFSATIDFRSSSYPEKRSDQCQISEIWDKYDRLCRPYECPRGAVPMQGRCEYVAIAPKSVMLHLLFDVELLQGDWAVLEENLNVFRAIIGRAIGESFSCGICWSILYQATNGSKIVYKYKFYTTENCPFEEMLKRTKRMVSKGTLYRKFNLLTKRFEVNFHPVLVEGGPMTIIAKDTTAGSTCTPLGKKETSYLLDAKQLQNCPRFEIPMANLSGLVIGDNETSQDLTIVANRSADIASICVDKYFEMRSSIGYSFGGHNLYVPATVLVLLSLAKELLYHREA